MHRRSPPAVDGLREVCKGREGGNEEAKQSINFIALAPGCGNESRPRDFYLIHMQNTNDIDLSESDYGFVITNERIHLSEKCIWRKVDLNGRNEELCW